MLQKNNKSELKKEGGDAAEFGAELEALLRDHKRAQRGKKQPTFISWCLTTPTERGSLVLERMMRELRLFKKYGITDLRGLVSTADSPWRKLALALAERHEDGFKLRGRGRPKEHDDPELVLMVELFRCRDDLSIAKACKAIAEKGVIRGKPGTRTLQNRYKELKRHHHWKVIIQVFEMIKAKVGVDQYIEALEEIVGGRIN